MVAWFVTSPPFDHCFFGCPWWYCRCLQLGKRDVSVLCWLCHHLIFLTRLVIAGVMVNAQLRFVATRLPFLIFFVLLSLCVFYNTIQKNFLGAMPCGLPGKRDRKSRLHPFTILAPTWAILKVRIRSLTNSSAFAIISLEIIAIFVVTIK